MRDRCSSCASTGLVRGDGSVDGGKEKIKQYSNKSRLCWWGPSRARAPGWYAGHRQVQPAGCGSPREESREGATGGRRGPRRASWVRGAPLVTYAAPFPAECWSFRTQATVGERGGVPGEGGCGGCTAAARSPLQTLCANPHPSTAPPPRHPPADCAARLATPSRPPPHVTTGSRARPRPQPRRRRGRRSCAAGRPGARGRPQTRPQRRRARPLAA